MGLFLQTLACELIQLQLSEINQALFVLDGLTQLVSVEPLLRVLKSHHAHIIVLPQSYSVSDMLIKDIDHALVRGCVIQNIEPLTRIHSTQRLVLTIIENVDFAPTNEDQQMLEQLVEFSTGSPLIVEMISQILLTYYKENQYNAANYITEILSLAPVKCQAEASGSYDHRLPVRTISENVMRELPKVATISSVPHRDVWETESQYDIWDSISKLVSSMELTVEEQFLLNCLSLFGCCPIPFVLITNLSSVITQATRNVHLASTLHHKLIQYKFIKPYPLPIVLSPAIATQLSYDFCEMSEYVYIPQLYAQSLWKNMERVDQVAALSVVHASISLLQQTKETSKSTIHGLCSLLLEVLGRNYSLVNRECYKRTYSLYLGTL